MKATIIGSKIDFIISQITCGDLKKFINLTTQFKLSKKIKPSPVMYTYKGFRGSLKFERFINLAASKLFNKSFISLFGIVNCNLLNNSLSVFALNSVDFNSRNFLSTSSFLYSKVITNKYTQITLKGKGA